MEEQTGTDEPEVFVVLRKIRYDLTAAQAKVSDAMNLLAAMDLPQGGGIACPRCGAFLKKGGERALALHIHNVHGGPVVPLSPEELRA